MIPAQAATQNTRRPAMCRSYSGLRARRWRSTKATSPTSATTASVRVRAPLFGTGAKLMARISDPTRATERMPPRWSTLSVVSLTWAGTKNQAISAAMAASGSVTRNTEPHQKCSSRNPATRGPSAATPPPMADQSAIDRVRPGPDQSAAIRASVVG